MSKIFINVKEFSQKTGISVPMTYKNIESGRLKAIKQNGPLSNWLIPASELENWPKRKTAKQQAKNLEIRYGV